MLGIGYKLSELNDMTISEMLFTLTATRKGQAYLMWRNAMLISWATLGKDYPKNPEDALPELFPPKKAVQMPDWLKEEWIKQQGGGINGRI